MFYLYIIYSSKLDHYYVGYTSNTKMSIYTAKASDWQLMYSEAFESRELAMKREKEIKRKKSRKYIEWLISSFG
jgi:putative endonuclease